jgi:hypothetical protein
MQDPTGPPTRIQGPAFPVRRPTLAAGDQSRPRHGPAWLSCAAGKQNTCTSAVCLYWATHRRFSTLNGILYSHALRTPAAKHSTEDGTFEIFDLAASPAIVPKSWRRSNSDSRLVRPLSSLSNRRKVYASYPTFGLLGAKHNTCLREPLLCIDHGTQTLFLEESS